MDDAEPLAWVEEAVYVMPWCLLLWDDELATPLPTPSN